MRIERETFKYYFTSYNSPIWDCPSCLKGKIHFEEKEITTFETNKSRKDKESDEWEPYYIRKHFVGKMQCNGKKYTEIFSIAGLINVEEDYEEDGSSAYTECFYPKHIYPIIHIFSLPDEIPDEVKEIVLDSFKLFWMDKSSCANAIRTAVKAILNDKKIV